MSEEPRVPPGPEASDRPADDLLGWMEHQFGRFGDIFKARAYGTNVYAVRDPELAYHVLVANWQNYVKGQFIKRVGFLLGNGLMASEGQLWKRQRKMVRPAFDQNSVTGLTRIITSANLDLLAKWQAAARRNNSVNVTRDVSGMVYEIVLRFIFGADYDHVRPAFTLLSDESARDMAFLQAFRGLREVIIDLVHRRRERQPSDNDLVNMLMTARDAQSGEPMSDTQLTDEVLTMVVAGHETTASTLNWMWYELSQHTDIEDKLAQQLGRTRDIERAEQLSDFPYSRQVIEETMRLYPAGWLMTRRALHDDQLGEYFVPAGSEIYIAPYFIQRHPDLWDNPDLFMPERFSPEKSASRHRLAMMPFSAGPRNCIGTALARLEMQLHLLIVSRHLRLRYVQTRPLELDAGVNLRNRFDFIMYPEAITPCAS